MHKNSKTSVKRSHNVTTVAKEGKMLSACGAAEHHICFCRNTALADICMASVQLFLSPRISSHTYKPASQIKTCVQVCLDRVLFTPAAVVKPDPA